MALNPELYQNFIPSSFPKKSVEKALTYKPSNNDLFIASYPKCGTTWTQQIVYLLLNKAVPPNKSILFTKWIPFLEFAEPESKEDVEENTINAFKTHLPFHLLPFNENSKYIYCIRNPKDCCASFWFHEKDFPLLECNSFEQFFDIFMNGNTGYGDYFDHVLGWLQNRDKSNILIVHYEDLKNDFMIELNRIASFISVDIHSELSNDKTFRENVIKFSSFEFMKETTNSQLKCFYDMPVEQLKRDEDILEAFKNAFCNIKTSGSVDISKDVNFVRKGIIGDYKTYFSDQQNEAIDQKITQKLGQFNDLLEKWKYLFD